MKLTTYFRKNKINQTAFGKRIGVTQGMVWQWLNNERRVSAEKVLAIEEATNGEVSRHEMRPDIYPRESSK